MLQREAGYIDARPSPTRSTKKSLATHGRTIHSGHNRSLVRQTNRIAGSQATGEPKAAFAVGKAGRNHLLARTTPARQNCQRAAFIFCGERYRQAGSDRNWWERYWFLSQQTFDQVEQFSVAIVTVISFLAVSIIRSTHD